MNKIVEAVKEGRKIETKDLFSVVNDFCLTRLAVKTSDGDSIVSMQVNKCEEYENEYEFSQSCIGFDDVSYHLKKNDIISAEGEYNTDVDTLYITCKLKNSLTVYFMIINVSGSENRTDEYNEMDVYELKDFLEDVLHEKNEYYCVFTRITDVFGFDLKMRNCIRTYVNTLDDSDWKLHISDDFTSFEVPVTDDSINEIYVKDNAESRSIIVKPYNQPFMEIDMLALRGENTSLTRDVSGEGVQQALLKILEGTIARVPFGGGRKHPNAECVNIDTSNILFICGGAFDGLEKLINQDKKVNRTIGFGVDAENISNEEEFILENVQQHDLVRYGMMPEFIGRLPVITTLAPLTENDMVRILTEPKNAIVRQFQELFAMDDVKLQFEKDALMKIAAIANEKRIGARGLRSIVENVLQKTMFELPDMKSAKKVVVNAECVQGDSEPVVYGARNKKIA